MSLGLVLLLALVSTVMAITVYVLMQLLWPYSGKLSGAPAVETTDKFTDAERLALEVLGSCKTALLGLDEH